MRLIDRDLLLSEIEKSRGKNPHKDYKIRANHIIEHDHIAHLVLEQPVAYNVDKVVEQLKKNHDVEKDRAAEYDEAGRLDLMDEHDAKATAYRNAIKIVKSGGIE